jgi:hypothetical protein
VVAAVDLDVELLVRKRRSQAFDDRKRRIVAILRTENDLNRRGVILIAE